MVSRTERTPFGDWWWTVDRLMLAALGALMLAGIVLSLAASPPVAARLGLDAVPFRQPPHPVPRRRRSSMLLGDLVPDAAPDPARRARRVRRQPGAGRGDAVLRRRDQGRAALDRDPRRQHPAVGIRQAGLRDPDRLAVRRDRRGGRKCRPTPWRSRCCCSWWRCWCCSPISARPC